MDSIDKIMIYSAIPIISIGMRLHSIAITISPLVMMLLRSMYCAK
jgi:hypothetical protein